MHKTRRRALYTQRYFVESEEGVIITTGLVKELNPFRHLRNSTISALNFNEISPEWIFEAYLSVGNVTDIYYAF